MQPIIRRTITITITETWTITWENGQETGWHETQEVAWPAVTETGPPLPPLADEAEGEAESDDNTPDPAASDLTAEDA